jgi:hypothetical protein
MVMTMILKLCVIDLTNIESIYSYFIEIYSDLFEIKSFKWEGKLSCRVRKFA